VPSVRFKGGAATRLGCGTTQNRCNARGARVAPSQVALVLLAAGSGAAAIMKSAGGGGGGGGGSGGAGRTAKTAKTGKNAKTASGNKSAPGTGKQAPGQAPKPPRKKSLREQYLGRTPGKKSRTGRKVQERMREEGTLRTNPRGEVEFKSGDKWYPLKEADMGHNTDAVMWWNTEGYKLGAKSPEVRKWMLDPDNYTLEHFSLNRSAGAKLGETYRPPLLP